MSLAYKFEDKYIYATYSLDFFEQVSDELRSASESKKLMILDEYGIFVYDSEGSKELQRMQCELFGDIITTRGEVLNEAVEIDGVKSLASMAEVDTQNLYIVVYESYSDILGFFANITATMAILIVAIVGIYLFGIFLSILIFKELLNKLYKSMKEVTSGNYGHKLETVRYREFRDIKTEFDAMSSSLEETTTRLKELAYFHQLTGLRSRVFLNEKFNELFKDKTELYCLYIDIERFQIINDSYGYFFGNKLMQAFAERLQTLPLEGVDTFKSEGDEFVVILSGKNVSSKIEETVNYISDILEKPFLIDDVKCNLTTSIGVTAYTKSTIDVEDLITHAIISMHEAKKEKTKGFHIYDESYTKTHQRSIEIELSVDDAFLNSEFYVVLQPIVHTDTQQVRGFEALSRWQHPTMNLIGPGEYISILERTKKIHKLDMYVLEEAIKLMKRLKKETGKDYVVSVNLSVDTILWPEFKSHVSNILKRTKFNPNLLELEVTETTIIQDYDLVSSIIADFRKDGVRFSEDDFGDGYSALNYLGRLDLTTLKISRNLTADLENSTHSETLIKHIIKLANELNLETIIEGVESKEVYETCANMGCTFIQGFYFAKALSYSDVLEFIKRTKQ